MYVVGPAGHQVALCLDCTLKQQQLAALQSEEYERELNFLSDQLESVTGMRSSIPRYPPRQRQIIQGANMTFNNINVSNSNVGVLNTGNLEIVESAITVLKSNSKTSDVGDAISKLVSAIANGDLEVKLKNEAIEILSTVSAEATQPPDKRKTSTLKVLLSHLPTILQTSQSLVELWNTVSPVILQYCQ